MTQSSTERRWQISTASVGPGQATAITWSTVALLVDAPPQHPAVVRASSIASPPTLPTLLGALTHDGIDGCPPFAAVLTEPEAVRVVHRGSAQVRPGDVVDVPRPDATILLSWVEAVWPVVTRARLTVGGARLDAATTLADELGVATVAGGPVVRPGVGTLDLTIADAISPEAAADGQDHSTRHHAEKADAVSPPAPQPTADIPPTGDAADDGPDLDFGHLFEETTYRRAGDADPSPSQLANAGAAGGSPSPAGHPGGTTGDQVEDPIAMPTIIPGAPAGPSAHQSPAATTSVAGIEAATGVPAPPVAPTSTPPAAAHPPPAAPDEDDIGLISAVPGMAPPPNPAPPPAPTPMPAVVPASAAVLPPPPIDPAAAVPAPTAVSPAPPPPPAPEPPATPAVPAPAPAREAAPQTAPSSEHAADLDDATVSIAAIRAARNPTPPAPVPTGPTVQAVLCPAGHANPSHADLCRTCDAPVTDRTIHTVARPSLGRIRFDDGTVNELDRHLVLGRNPAPDTLVGDEPADLVRLDDPDHLLSRTHLVLRLDGWQVQAVDRDSLNHTYVQVPGRPAFQLRPGEPYPLPPGTIVRLGDEIGFTYEVGDPEVGAP